MTGSTNTGTISCRFNVEQTISVLKHPPILWTVKSARIHLFTRKFDVNSPFESVLSTETELAAQLLQTPKINDINCRIIARGQLVLPRRQILGLIKQVLKKNIIELKFQRSLPEYLLNLTPNRIRGYVEIGKNFRPQFLVRVHHTPLSPVAAYALYSLTQQTQSQDNYVLLDPMCGNGTILLVGLLEARRMGKNFRGIGIDQDTQAIDQARENLRVHSGDVAFYIGKIEDFDPNALPAKPTHIFTHPPYGFAPAIDQESLTQVYDALFRVFSKFPNSLCGMVTPHRALILDLIQKYSIRTLILRPFQQKTLPSFLWVGQYTPN
ncbi:MAG: hypothetical protein RBG13Loki_1473 [Promethearchaeota archaeon CR_4]|nr:MAG: hypothetical protein RBG13Loki_1473 [Candidatus Lokiarchaeota archaeon CR_4]